MDRLSAIVSAVVKAEGTNDPPESLEQVMKDLAWNQTTLSIEVMSQLTDGNYNAHDDRLSVLAWCI